MHISRIVNLLYAVTLIVLIFGPATVASAKEISEKPYFYEVEYHGNKSYLLGTIHHGVGLENLPSIVTEKMSAAHIIFVEQKIYDAIEVRAMLTNSTGRILNLFRERNRFYNWGSSPLNTRQFNQLVELGVPTSVIPHLRCDDYKDFSFLFLDSKWVFPIEFSMDNQILDKAYYQGKQIVELDKPGLREAADLAEKGTKRENSEKNSSCSLTEMLENPNLDKIIQMAESYRLQYLRGSLQEYESKSVAYRNIAWAKELSTFLKRGTHFIAVGAGHFVIRTDNLINLLRAEGFSVTRIQ
jgi:uncharacterized protein YbaP (TraB family)